ncbi:MAG: iron ABC transporter permease, partial [Candidatus Thiodiazotropha sp. (ex Lucinoma annulata)]|nr:iron ABC transporter permease [Candidatus Thiodiazotropha sp. (ex Lucinoma annulata)]
VGSAISVTGAIGFIGLVVPHLLRPLVGYQPSRLLVPSAMGGGLLLLLADIGVRLLPAQGEIKVGVVTALIGAPFFLWLIIQGKRSGL